MKKVILDSLPFSPTKHSRLSTIEVVQQNTVEVPESKVDIRMVLIFKIVGNGSFAVASQCS